MDHLRNYTRWRQQDGLLHADILGAPLGITVDTAAGKVLADGPRAIRAAGGSV